MYSCIYSGSIEVEAENIEQARNLATLAAIQWMREGKHGATEAIAELKKQYGMPADAEIPYIESADFSSDYDSFDYEVAGILNPDNGEEITLDLTEAEVDLIIRGQMTED